jgi:hypothetical protein
MKTFYRIIFERIEESDDRISTYDVMDERFFETKTPIFLADKISELLDQHTQASIPSEEFMMVNR